MSLVVPPYPPARYCADEPEVSAWLKRGDEPPDHDSFGLVQYRYLADQHATGGDYGLYRVDIAAKAGGPGPHFHRAMSEAFFVLAGSIELYDGTDWKTGGGGDFLYGSSRTTTFLSNRPHRHAPQDTRGEDAPTEPVGLG
ncbi:MAG: cupin protein [Mycobacterium sp.]|nr:cupin protein [Mycobacterium sp.]